jgi:toxin secretion/phage lysis holin
VETLSFIKSALVLIFSVISGIVLKHLGGYDVFLKTLITFMVFDIVTGSLAAAVRKRSGKAEPGRIGIGAGMVGLVRKGCILMVVMIAVQLDQLMHSNELTRDAVIIALMFGELVSILENLSILGIKMPKALLDAVEMFNHKKRG